MNIVWTNDECNSVLDTRPMPSDNKIGVNFWWSHPYDRMNVSSQIPLFKKKAKLLDILLLTIS